GGDGNELSGAGRVSECRLVRDMVRPVRQEGGDDTGQGWPHPVRYIQGGGPSQVTNLQTALSPLLGPLPVPAGLPLEHHTPGIPTQVPWTLSVWGTARCR